MAKDDTAEHIKKLQRAGVRGKKLTRHIQNIWRNKKEGTPVSKRDTLLPEGSKFDESGYQKRQAENRKYWNTIQKKTGVSYKQFWDRMFADKSIDIHKELDNLERKSGVGKYAPKSTPTKPGQGEGGFIRAGGRAKSSREFGSWLRGQRAKGHKGAELTERIKNYWGGGSMPKKKYTKEQAAKKIKKLTAFNKAIQERGKLKRAEIAMREGKTPTRPKSHLPEKMERGKIYHKDPQRWENFKRTGRKDGKVMSTPTKPPPIPKRKVYEGPMSKPMTHPAPPMSKPPGHLPWEQPKVEVPMTKSGGTSLKPNPKAGQTRLQAAAAGAAAFGKNLKNKVSGYIPQGVKTAAGKVARNFPTVTSNPMNVARTLAVPGVVGTAGGIAVKAMKDFHDQSTYHLEGATKSAMQTYFNIGDRYKARGYGKGSPPVVKPPSKPPVLATPKGPKGPKGPRTPRTPTTPSTGGGSTRIARMPRGLQTSLAPKGKIGGSYTPTQISMPKTPQKQGWSNMQVAGIAAAAALGTALISRGGRKRGNTYNYYGGGPVSRNYYYR